MERIAHILVVRGRKMLAFFAMLFVCALNLSAQGATADSTSAGNTFTFSVLTCSPGQEIYSLYGHTALRMIDHKNNRDLVFNYGVFDFNKPHFAWHFVLGQTDYELAAYPYNFFLEEYIQRGSSVNEQVLNLNADESLCLFALLIENARRENCVYRYNFLTNNCTTQVRDIIERAVNGTVVYDNEQIDNTYRSILHQFTGEHPWAQDGNDILLGANCDTTLTDRTSMFIPSRLESYLRTAQVFDKKGNRHPLVKSEAELTPLKPQVIKPEFPLTPTQTGWLFFAICIVLFGIERLTKRMMYGVDALLMFVHGLLGILLCFLFLFSEHPTLDSNWLIAIFNPIPLIMMPRVIRSAWAHRVCFYHYVAAAAMLLFIAFLAWIPQQLPVIALPVILGLLSRHLSYYFDYRKR